MNLRQTMKILKSGKLYRLSTFKRACMKLNKTAPKWVQSLEISGVVCRCWADAMVAMHRYVKR